MRPNEGFQREKMGEKNLCCAYFNGKMSVLLIIWVVIFFFLRAELGAKFWSLFLLCNFGWVIAEGEG